MAARVRIRSGDWRCPEPTHANLICRACGRSGIRWGRDQRPPCKCESVWASIRSWTSLLAAVSVAFLVPCLGSIGLPRCTARPTHHQAPASARRRRCAGGAVALLMQACSRPAASAPAIMPSPKGTSRRHADEPGTSQQVTRPSDMHACTHTHAPGPSTTSAALLPAFLLPEYWVPKLSFRLEP